MNISLLFFWLLSHPLPKRGYKRALSQSGAVFQRVSQGETLSGQVRRRSLTGSAEPWPISAPLTPPNVCPRPGVSGGAGCSCLMGIFGQFPITAERPRLLAVAGRGSASVGDFARPPPQALALGVLRHITTCCSTSKAEIWHPARRSCCSSRPAAEQWHTLSALPRAHNSRAARR